MNAKMLFALLILLFAGFASAECAVYSSSASAPAGWEKILSMSAATNAHVSGDVGYYSYYLACNTPIAPGTAAKLMGISSVYNAHAEVPDYTNYPEEIWLDGVGSCYYGSDCGSGTEILTLSSLTNAHVGEPGSAGTKICCGESSVIDACEVNGPLTITIGDTETYGLLCYSTGSLVSCGTSTADWSSSNELVATLTTPGDASEATGIGLGSTEVGATLVTEGIVCTPLTINVEEAQIPTNNYVSIEIETVDTIDPYPIRDVFFLGKIPADYIGLRIDAKKYQDFVTAIDFDISVDGVIDTSYHLVFPSTITPGLGSIGVDSLEAGNRVIKAEITEVYVSGSEDPEPASELADNSDSKVITVSDAGTVTATPELPPIFAVFIAIGVILAILRENE